MEEKNVTKISLSTFFLILAIIAIIVMGVYIYKLKIDKKSEIQKSTDLQTQVSDSNGTVSELQEKTNSISETINTSNVNTSIEKNNESNEKVNTFKVANKSDIKIGTYNADEEKFDGAGVGYGDCGVTLANNNLCSVYEGYGTSHLGTYSIEKNKLICNTLISRGEEGEIAYSEYNIIFEFEIINSQKIKLTKITNNSNKKLDSPGLVEGMTYSFSENSHIKVILDD